MSYIGNEPTSVAFLTDTFSGNGSTTAFTMSAAPATTTSILVAVTGVLQDPSTYSVVGTTLTFSAAPPSGTGNISVRYLGIPASGVTTTAYRTITEFTATAGQTTFTPPSYTPGFINVYRNGVMLGTADYTASNGTTVVLATGAISGDLITTESFYVSSVLNALPQTGGTLSGSLVVNGATGQNPLIVQNNGTEAMRVNSSGNVGIGTSSPNSVLHLNKASGAADLRFSVAGTLYCNFYASAFDTTITSITAIPLILGTNNTERMRIAADGNVGIGTNSPAGLLHLSSTGSVNLILDADTDNVTESDNPTLTFKQDGGVVVANMGFREAANQFYITNTYSSSGIVLGTNNVDRFYIDSSGSYRAGYPTDTSGTLYPAFFCRAWVNFNGTGTVAIRGSGNVTSITDNGVGDYTVNFTTAMPDANYSSNVTANNGSPSAAGNYVYMPLGYVANTSSYRFNSGHTGAAYIDCASINVAIFR